MTDIRKTDLNLLVTFFTLAEELSVSRAAGRLGVSQPGVSAALKRLRQLFGDPLLVRTSNGMQLPSPRGYQVRDDNPVHKWIRGLFSEIFCGKT